MDKILVIDDEKATLTMFRLLLGAYGYAVLTAENGSEGLEIFQKEKPSIVFTDIKMPGMDGFQVLQHVKEIDSMAEVIVITGHGDMDLAVKALNLSATDFLNKPIQRQDLDTALKRAHERLGQIKGKEGEISLRSIDDVIIIDIQGNVTSASETFLMRAYENASAQGVTKIVMHFNESSTINGAGIAILIQLLSESKKRDQVVAITGLSENFKKIFDIVGITRLAKIFEQEEQAIKSLSQGV